MFFVLAEDAVDDVCCAVTAGAQLATYARLHVRVSENIWNIGDLQTAAAALQCAVIGFEGNTDSIGRYVVASRPRVRGTDIVLDVSAGPDNTVEVCLQRLAAAGAWLATGLAGRHERDGGTYVLSPEWQEDARTSTHFFAAMRRDAEGADAAGGDLYHIGDALALVGVQRRSIVDAAVNTQPSQWGALEAQCIRTEPLFSRPNGALVAGLLGAAGMLVQVGHSDKCCTTLALANLVSITFSFAERAPPPTHGLVAHIYVAAAKLRATCWVPPMIPYLDRAFADPDQPGLELDGWASALRAAAPRYLETLQSLPASLQNRSQIQLLTSAVRAVLTAAAPVPNTSLIILIHSGGLT